MQKKLMKVNDYPDGTSFWRIACDCHEPNHDLQLWFEPDNDREYLDLNLTMEVGFYSYNYSPGDTTWEAIERRVENFRKRIRHAVKVLFTGYATMEGNVILSKDGVKAMQFALDKGIEHFEKVKEQQKKQP